MARSETHFACTDCGHNAPRWTGRCPACGEWNTLVEEKNSPAATEGSRGGAWRGGPGVGSMPGEPRKPVPLSEVESLALERLGTGSDEFDRVLGGGIVPGSIVLVGGSPGIGKST